jgi:hypothetical protein
MFISHLIIPLHTRCQDEQVSKSVPATIHTPTNISTPALLYVTLVVIFFQSPSSPVKCYGFDLCHFSCQHAGRWNSFLRDLRDVMFLLFCAAMSQWALFSRVFCSVPADINAVALQALESGRTEPWQKRLFPGLSVWISGQSVWDLWWSQRYWVRFVS